jgi:hypothetical protein
VRAPPPGVRLVINRQKRGRKASTPSQTEPHVEQVATDSESKGAYVRVVMETLPTLARISLPKGRRQAQKGRALGPYNTLVYGIHPAESPAQSTRPKVTQNGHTERWNPSVALRLSRSRRPGRMP